MARVFIGDREVENTEKREEEKDDNERRKAGERRVFLTSQFRMRFYEPLRCTFTGVKELVLLHALAMDCLCEKEGHHKHVGVNDQAATLLPRRNLKRVIVKVFFKTVDTAPKWQHVRLSCFGMGNGVHT